MTRTLNLDQWAGRWVAIDANNQVVRDGDTMDGLYADLKREGIFNVTIVGAPLLNEPVTFGLG